MKYLAKTESNSDKKIAVSDMFLTTDMPTTAGSKMLDKYVSLIEAEVITKLKNAGYVIAGKVNVGEFDVDLLGETSYFGNIYKDGVLKNPSAEVINDGVKVVLNLDVNGSVRRSASQNGLVAIKPTYGTVSRYGTIPVACSGETVSVLSKCVNCGKEVLDVIRGHDDKDGTSLPSVNYATDKKNKIAIVKEMLSGISDDVKANLDSVINTLKESGIQVVEISAKEISYAKTAWNVLMSAELCNNVSRYDGVKYGYRTENFTNIDELYTNSRTEAFGELLKTAILYGSETLSTDNYQKVYDKALRVRRVIANKFNEIFGEFDAVVMPTCSVTAYTKEMIESDKYLAYKENFFTAPSSITGLPTVTVSGVQLVGKAFSEEILIDLARVCEKGGKQ